MNPTYRPREFAKRAGVTIRALHHYDRIGLLKPSGRTAAGYRVYSDRDFARLEQIVALKFIGFPLFQIREILQRKDNDLSAALRQQRQIMVEKRDHLDRAVQAIDRAAKIVATGGEPDWEPFRKVIEVIQMQTRKDWMKKYYTEDQLANLRQRLSLEVQTESESGWAALARDTEEAIASGTDPAGETGLQLAARPGKNCWRCSLAVTPALNKTCANSMPTKPTGQPVSRSRTVMPCGYVSLPGRRCPGKEQVSVR